MDTENTTITEKIPYDGYDLEVYGLANGRFYSIHIPAICCILTSLGCVLTVLVLSFRRQSYRTFFQWAKSERFVVYLAICDGLFNAAHIMDHLHMLITKNHVYPKELCEFYAFILTVFVTAQNLMVNVVAINAFMLIYLKKNLNLGRYDWVILAWTFGVPFAGAVVVTALGLYGTNGTFCYFDAVKGHVAVICFTTIPLFLILIMNIVFYTLTWQKIHSETRRIRKTLGRKPASVRAEHHAAKAMSLFVAAFFIQWWALSIYGIWALIGHVPEEYFYLLVTFDNLGGVFNLGVYIIIRRQRLTKPEKPLPYNDKIVEKSCSNRTCETSFSSVHQGSSEKVWSLDLRD